MDVASLAVAPGCEHLLRVVRHDFRVRRNAFAMKRGLRQPPLSQPRLSFVGQEAVAKKPSALADDVVFEKILVIAYQYSFDQVGMIEEINMDPRGAIIENVAVLSRPAGECRQRIGTGQRHVANGETRFGAGRAFHATPRKNSGEPSSVS